jgi:endonuclease I
MKLSKRDKRMFKAWDEKYPSTAWEELRNKRINNILYN